MPFNTLKVWYWLIMIKYHVFCFHPAPWVTPTISKTRHTTFCDTQMWPTSDLFQRQAECLLQNSICEMMVLSLPISSQKSVGWENWLCPCLKWELKCSRIDVRQKWIAGKLFGGRLQTKVQCIIWFMIVHIIVSKSCTYNASMHMHQYFNKTISRSSAMNIVNIT